MQLNNTRPGLYIYIICGGGGVGSSSGGCGGGCGGGGGCGCGCDGGYGGGYGCGRKVITGIDPRVVLLSRQPISLSHTHIYLATPTPIYLPRPQLVSRCDLCNIVGQLLKSLINNS